MPSLPMLLGDPGSTGKKTVSWTIFSYHAIRKPGHHGKEKAMLCNLVGKWPGMEFPIFSCSSAQEREMPGVPSLPMPSRNPGGARRRKIALHAWLFSLRRETAGHGVLSLLVPLGDPNNVGRTKATLNTQPFPLTGKWLGTACPLFPCSLEAWVVCKAERLGAEHLPFPCYSEALGGVGSLLHAWHFPLEGK